MTAERKREAMKKAMKGEAKLFPTCPVYNNAYFY